MGHNDVRTTEGYIIKTDEKDDEDLSYCPTNLSNFRLRTKPLKRQIFKKRNNKLIAINMTTFDRLEKKVDNLTEMIRKLSKENR